MQRLTYSPRKCDQSCSWRHDLRWNAAYYLMQRCTYSPRKFDQSCSWSHDFRWNAAYYLMQRCTYSPRKCDQSWWHGDSTRSIESSQTVPFLRTPFFLGSLISRFNLFTSFTWRRPCHVLVYQNNETVAMLVNPKKSCGTWTLPSSKSFYPSKKFA